MAEESEILHKIITLISENSGINFNAYKITTIERRIEKRISFIKKKSLSQYLNYLQSNAEELIHIKNDLLIGVTEFYRDPEVFERLETLVFPIITNNDKIIRIWVPACCTGEEAYSLGMLLHHYIEKQNLQADFKIFATDISSTYISFAGKGEYSAQALQKIDKEYIERYFLQTESGYHVRKFLREKIVFAQHNLIADPPFINMDLISCRNLLIYLQKDIQQQVLSNFVFSLKKNGFLQLGNSESLGELSDNFVNMGLHHKLYRNRTKKKLRYSLDNKTRQVNMALKNNDTNNEHHFLQNKPSMNNTAIKNIINNLLPQLILTDCNYNIVYLKGDISKYIAIEDGLFQPNFLKMIHDESAIILKKATIQVQKDKKPALLKNFALQTANGTYKVDLKISLEDKDEEQFLLFIFEDEKQVNSPTHTFKIPKLDNYCKQRIKDLETILEDKSSENENLKTELSTLKEKMQASNEELLAANEELQATNEEFQSVNEELYSLNSEYQSKNIRLAELNNDINNLLNSTDIATLFLDKDLNIRNFTSKIQAHFKLEHKDIGRSFSSFSSHFCNLIIEEIIKDCNQVLVEGAPLEAEISDIHGYTFIRKITPFLTSEQTIEGVVLSFIDITSIIETKKKIKESELRYRKLITTMPAAFSRHRIITDVHGNYIDYEFLEVNSMFETITGLKNTELIGKTARQVFNSLDDKWIQRYGKVSENQIPVHFIDYSKEINSYFDITVYSAQKGYFVTIFTDITQEILKNNKLKESEEKYRNLIDNSLVGVYQTTIDGQLLFANDAFLSILGYDSKNEISKVNVEDFYTVPKDRLNIIKQLKEFGSINNFDCKFKTKKGNQIDILISAKLIGDELHGMIMDVSDRARYYKEIIESKRRFNDLKQSSIDGYGRTSIDGKFIEVNKALCDMLDYSEAELLTKSFYDITPPSWHSFEKKLISHEVLKKGHSSLYQKEFLRKDGTIIPVELRSYLTLGEEGEPYELWAFVHNITDRHAKEQLLQENKQRLELALNAGKQGLFDLNVITGEAIVNDEYALMLDYNPKTFFETNALWRERIHPEDKLKTEKIYDDYIHGITNEYRVEYRQKCHGGNYKWILSVGKIVSYNAEGKPERLLGTHTNIDELKNSQIKLARSQERFRLATKASNVGIWDWDLQNDSLYFSSTWKSQLGYDPDELENHFETWKQLLHPDDIVLMPQRLMQYISNPKSYFQAEFRLRHKKGHYVWIYNKASAIKNSKGKVIRMYGAHTDITITKEAQLKLDTLSRRLSLATQSADIGIWELDTSSKHLFWDDRMFEIYMLDRSHFNNSLSDWSKTVIPKDLEKAIKIMEDPMLGKKDFNIDFHIVCPNGERKCIHSQAIITKNPDGSGNKMVGVNWDITQQEKINSELIKAKEKAEVANVHKNNFLANMSHEIRTPMNGIIGFADLLRNEDTTQEQKELYLRIINNNSQSLLSLIDDIIDISKIEANEISIYKEAVNINDVLLELETEYNNLKISRNKHNITFECVTDQKLVDVSIYTDKLRLRQILINLLNNALKFTEKGIIRFGCQSDNKKIEFFVIDDGIGIPKDKADEIFERFYRLDTKEHRKYSGTGLGLAISKGLITLLGGNIWVDQAYKNGAAIYFTIPFKKINRPTLTGSNATILKSIQQLDGLTVLLVEDQESIYTFFKEVLSSTGMQLLWDTCGEDAIETYKSKTQEINLVLMDINLPGITGIETTKTILEYDPSAIIIAQTAYAMPEELEKCTNAGCIDYITKPIKPQMLLDKLKKYC